MFQMFNNYFLKKKVPNKR